MSFIEIFLIGAGLSMDAFAVSVCKGLGMRKVDCKYTVMIGLFFGGFQAFMPFIGWFIGSKFEKYITRFDHWIAFGLLVVIGGKMLYDTLHDKDDEHESYHGIDYKELFVLAVATSIDALAVGITFAFLGMHTVNILTAVSIIGVTTFVFSVLGVFIGNRFGTVYKRKAEIAGGIVLILIGVKILLEHLGLINF